VLRVKGAVRSAGAVTVPGNAAVPRCPAAGVYNQYSALIGRVERQRNMVGEEKRSSPGSKTVTSMATAKEFSDRRRCHPRELA